MKRILILFIILNRMVLFAQDSIRINVPGLIQPVTINKDQWGVSHIYASTEQDLFFAQGYHAAKDRLFQFELFRRQATGSAAEILGEKELIRDIGARLFQFRGDIDKEMKHYHPHGDVIIRSFVKGINAYIAQVLSEKESLPVEFQWLGIKPGYWTPEVVVSRHNGLLGNIQEELNTARAVSQIGMKRVIDIMNFKPHLPSLEMDPLLTKEALKEDILKFYNAYRKPIQFESSDLIGMNDGTRLNQLNALPGYAKLKSYEGSNNWVINGSKSASGFPILANDPHRAITIPSLRYITHLQAPGWNVIGGGEPILPGVSIGHNEYGAWGLTIFETDIEDLYVYKLNPSNTNQYWHTDRWNDFKSIPDTIHVKNHSPVPVMHRYTIHGPVTYIDSARHLAYAVRCAWLEPGSAPYLASLRMDQSRTWDEFKQACKYAYVPAENMVWVDRKGNIGWQTVGIVPIRNTSGMVPVTDDKKNEWGGYLPILKRPSSFNPSTGLIATANENLTPEHYPYMNTIGYNWSDPYRGQRIREILGKTIKMTTHDMEALQTDYQSLPARAIIPMITQLNIQDQTLALLQVYLSEWNQKLNPESAMAGLYVLIERYLEENLLKSLIPENYDETKNNDVPITSLSTEWMIQYIRTAKNKNDILLTAFLQAANKMKSMYGDILHLWKYGDTVQYKHVYIQHALSKTVNEYVRQKINTPNKIRGGNGNTVGSTGDNDNQTSGASFRIIIDCGDWDLAKSINSPGQSGNPDNRHYKDLFELWAKNEYFPLYFSKEKINTVTEKVIVMK